MTALHALWAAGCVMLFCVCFERLRCMLRGDSHLYRVAWLLLAVGSLIGVIEAWDAVLPLASMLILFAGAMLLVGRGFR